MSKNKDEVVDKIMKQMSGTLEALSNSLLCPACDKAARKPFFNLGEEYNWAEGCAPCAKRIRDAVWEDK